MIVDFMKDKCLPLKQKLHKMKNQVLKKDKNIKGNYQSKPELKKVPLKVLKINSKKIVK